MFLALVACSAGSETIRPANYAGNAKDVYERGEAELKSENWADAARYFLQVRNKFSFSRYATLAELGLADADLGREKYQEAIDGYRAFIKNHPTHERVQDGYCAYRIAEADYKQIPSEWFLVPASYEKDQGPVRDALRELSLFVDDYPDSKHLPAVRKLLADCTRRLVEHEIYVAEFYLGRNKPVATVARLEGVLRDRPRSVLEPQVLLLLGRTYLKMEKPDEAHRVFDRLIATYPTDYHAGKAKLYLEHIRARYPASPTPAPAPTPTPVAAEKR